MILTQRESFLIEVISSTAEETFLLGERIARKLGAGAVVALRGALGAGKTCLAQGIARGLGVSENVTSPTYTIMSEYRGRIPLYHIDAYRLSGDDDFENTGAGEVLGGDGVALIEWSERIPQSIPADAITIDIAITGPNSRLIRIAALENLDG